MKSMDLTVVFNRIADLAGRSQQSHKLKVSTNEKIPSSTHRRRPNIWLTVAEPSTTGACKRLSIDGLLLHHFWFL
jgi:hypothetical protein